MSWLPSKKNILYIYGPAGVGKTTFIEHLIAQLNVEKSNLNITYHDLSRIPPSKQRNILASRIKENQSQLNQLIILDGIYDTRAACDLLEEVLIATTPNNKFVIASRKAPAGGWLISPVLKPVTSMIKISDLPPGQVIKLLGSFNFKSQLFNRLIDMSRGRPLVINNIQKYPGHYQKKEKLPAKFAAEVISVFMNEVDNPKIYPYIEAAAFCWRFNRDLLDRVDEEISPMDYRNLTKCSFVYTDQTGMYLDPLLKNAVQSWTKPDTPEERRAKIHSFSLREATQTGTAPLHIMNSIYTLPAAKVPSLLFIEPPQEVIVKEANIQELKIAVQDNWVIASSALNKETPEALDLLAEEKTEIITVIENGHITAAAAIANLHNFINMNMLYPAPSLQQNNSNNKLLLFLGSLKDQPWAFSCLIRHIVAINMGKCNILIHNPSPSLVQVLDPIAVKRDRLVYELNLLTRSFPEWIRDYRAKGYRHQWEKREVVDAVRKTLRKLNQLKEPGDAPLFILWYHNPVSVSINVNPNVNPVFNKFKSILNGTLHEMQAMNAENARFLSVIYIQRSTTLRDLSNKMNIPERTLYRKLQETLYNLGMAVINKMNSEER